MKIESFKPTEIGNFEPKERQYTIYKINLLLLSRYLFIFSWFSFYAIHPDCSVNPMHSGYKNVNVHSTQTVCLGALWI